jgi:hypothetical protein
MLPGEGSDIVNFIEDLPAIQSIFKSWHRSLTLADKTREGCVGLHLHLLRSQIWSMQALPHRTSTAVFAVTYCAVGLKSARRIRLPTCHVGAIREAGLNENEKHRNCDSTLKQHPSRTARGFTQFLSPVS